MKKRLAAAIVVLRNHRWRRSHPGRRETHGRAGLQEQEIRSP